MLSKLLEGLLGRASGFVGLVLPVVGVWVRPECIIRFILVLPGVWVCLRCILKFIFLSPRVRVRVDLWQVFESIWVFPGFRLRVKL